MQDLRGPSPGCAHPNRSVWLVLLGVLPSVQPEADAGAIAMITRRIDGERVLELRKAGLSLRAIGARLGLSDTTIARILKRHSIQKPAPKGE